MFNDLKCLKKSSDQNDRTLQSRDVSGTPTSKDRQKGSRTCRWRHMLFYGGLSAFSSTENQGNTLEERSDIQKLMRSRKREIGDTVYIKELLKDLGITGFIKDEQRTFHHITDGSKEITEEGSGMSTPRNYELRNRRKLLRAKKIKIIYYSDQLPNFNCYSLVFTNGKARHISEKDVENIISDNNYKEILTSAIGKKLEKSSRGLLQRGDVVIYRNTYGKMIHAGIVAGIENGKIYVVSKWGYAGLYLHRISVFGDPDSKLSEAPQSYTIFRTDRKMGRLLGVSRITEPRPPLRPLKGSRTHYTLGELAGRLDPQKGGGSDQKASGQDSGGKPSFQDSRGAEFYTLGELAGRLGPRGGGGAEFYTAGEVAGRLGPQKGGGSDQKAIPGNRNLDIDKLKAVADSLGPLAQNQMRQRGAFFTGRYLIERAWEEGSRGNRERINWRESEKEPKKKKRSVSMCSQKGECDVFFSDQYSPLAKAGSRDAAQPLEGGGDGARITEFRDSDPRWVRDHETLQWVSQN